MKVKCPKCATGYSVNNDKIPEKGASVKCLRCGNKFSIKKPSVVSQKASEESTDADKNVTQADGFENKPLGKKRIFKDVVEYKPDVFKCARIRCKFWVEPSDLFCPNCGANIPKTAIGRVFQKFIKLSNKKTGAKSNNNLCKEEKRIENTLKMLHQKKMKFLKSIKAIDKREGRRLLPIKLKLEKTIEIINFQIRKAEIGFWQIELLRWANTLKPVTAKYYRISTESECVKILKRLKRIQKCGFKLQKSWNKRKDLLAIEKGERQIEGLEQTLHSCETLIEELMAKHADFGIKSISNMQFSGPSQDTSPINQIFTMMAMAQIQENEIKTIDEDIERELNAMEAKINSV